MNSASPSPKLPPGTRPGEVPGIVRPAFWPPASIQPRRLNSRVVRVLHGVAEACAPRDENFSATPEQIETAVRRIDELMARMDWVTAFALGVVTGLLEWSCVLRHGRRFSALKTADRARVLARWQHGRLQPRPVIANQLVGLCQYGFFSQPTIEAEIGYVPGERVQKLVKERQRNHGAPPL